jgi:hypothetical protein
MNKRKFSLGEIVSKLNRERPETQASSPLPQSSTTHSEENGSVEKNEVDPGHAENTKSGNLPTSENSISAQPVNSQTDNRFGKISCIHLK